MLNKSIAIIFLIILASCSSSPSVVNENAPFNTELYCPSIYYRFLILKTTKKEVMDSIEKAIEYRRKSNKKSRYTVLYFPHGASTSIYNITPEELKKCGIRELPRKIDDQK